MQQNEIYNIPLPRGPGPKTKTQKKGNESGINYPGELKTLNSSRVHNSIFQTKVRKWFLADRRQRL
jgi:hypothetical protein